MAEMDSGWLMPGGDWNHCRYSPVDVKPPLKLAWASPPESTLLSGQDVVGWNGRVIYTTFSGPVVALNYDGTPLWKWQPKKRAKMSTQGPCVVDNKIFLARESRLQCFGADGTLLWERENTKRADIAKRDGSESDFYDVYGGICGADPKGIFVCSSGGALRQFAYNDGKLLWSYFGGESSSPSFIGMSVISQFLDDGFSIYHLSNRKLRGFEPAFVPGVRIDNIGYNTLNEKLVGVDLIANKDVLGKRDPNGRTDPGKLATDGKIIVTQLQNHLIAFRAADGAELWRTPSVRNQYMGSEVVISPSYVYAVHSTERYGIQILDKTSGRVVHEYRENIWQGVVHNPSIIGGRLFVQEANRIVCLEGS